MQLLYMLMICLHDSAIFSSRSSLLHAFSNPGEPDEQSEDSKERQRKAWDVWLTQRRAERENNAEQRQQEVEQAMKAGIKISRGRFSCKARPGETEVWHPGVGYHLQKHSMKESMDFADPRVEPEVHACMCPNMCPACILPEPDGAPEVFHQPVPAPKVIGKVKPRNNMPAPKVSASTKGPPWPPAPKVKGKSTDA